MMILDLMMCIAITVPVYVYIDHVTSNMDRDAFWLRPKMHEIYGYMCL